MKNEVLKYYRKFRAAGMGGIVGEDASSCLDSARTLAQFTELETDGQVRLRMEPEQESYFSVYGYSERGRDDEETQRLIESQGVWFVVAEYQDHAGRWLRADSVGMCIYDNPLSPFENCYIIGLMSAAIACVESDSVVI
jgi:hypothetical protein